MKLTRSTRADATHDSDGTVSSPSAELLREAIGSIRSAHRAVQGLGLPQPRCESGAVSATSEAGLGAAQPRHQRVAAALPYQLACRGDDGCDLVVRRAGP